MVRHRMAYIGHEPQRQTLKYRCPARHQGWQRPSDQQSNAGKCYGKTVRVKQTIDLRLTGGDCTIDKAARATQNDAERHLSCFRPRLEGLILTSLWDECCLFVARMLICNGNEMLICNGNDDGTVG